jgi:hypothetical protein
MSSEIAIKYIGIFSLIERRIIEEYFTENFDLTSKKVNYFD